MRVWGAVPRYIVELKETKVRAVAGVGVVCALVKRDTLSNTNRLLVLPRCSCDARCDVVLRATSVVGYMELQ
jgi:hypothetical protein